MIYRFATFSVDPERLELADRGNTIAVQPQVFALLVFLIENRDRVVTKDDIIEAVWDGRIVSDGTLNARINALRRALGDSGEEQAVVRTFPRRGFRFMAEVEADKQTAETPPATAAIAAVAPAAPIGQVSIAVLPFNNLSGDPEQDYFADGMTEDLITDLSKARELFVIARNSAFSFKERSTDVRDIGRTLGVGHILEGSVRKVGARVRINAQLIDAASGGHLWAERYDGSMEDIFALQDEITAKIVSALKINLTAGQATGRHTESVEAYELNLRGRAKFFMFSPESNAECIRLFERALEIDPEFSDAWSGQVFPYQSGWSFAWPGYDDGLTIAVEKAEKAVELAPTSSFAQSRLGWVQTFLARPEDSIASFERALELDPNNADTHAWFAEALNFAGDPGRAVEMGETSLLYDPVAPPNCIFHIGHAHFLLGNLELAEEKIGRAIEMAPGFPVPRVVMAAAQVELGNVAEARLQIAQLKKIYSDYNFKAFNERYPYFDGGHRARMLAGLKKAGLTESA